MSYTKITDKKQAKEYISQLTSNKLERDIEYGKQLKEMRYRVERKEIEWFYNT